MLFHPLYTQLFAEHRKSWLSIDAQLLEVSGLIERFRDAVSRLNAGSASLKEMETHEQFLHAARGINSGPRPRRRLAAERSGRNV